MTKHEFGEGVMSLNKAENYVIKQIRFAARKWNLSERGVRELQNRINVCESATFKNRSDSLLKENQNDER